jgi:hypothetical protein
MSVTLHDVEIVRETDGAIIVSGDLEPLTKNDEARIPKAAIVTGDDDEWIIGQRYDLQVHRWFVFRREGIPGEDVPPPDWWAPEPPRGREVQSMVSRLVKRPPGRTSG